MDRTLAQGRVAPDPPLAPPEPRRITVNAGVAIVLAMLAIYLVSNPVRANFYNHFVWQASAWLEGQSAIRYPVYRQDGLGAANDYFQDVVPVAATDGVSRGLIPFPPLPAVVLLPFVALFGLATNAQLIASILGALVVGLAFWVLGRLPVRPSVRIATTILFGLGTVFWYAAELGSTWFLAHVVAVGLTFLSIALALEGDPRAVEGAAHDDWEDPLDRAGAEGDAARAEAAREAAASADVAGRSGKHATLAAPRGPAAGLAAAWRTIWPLDGRQLLAGLFLGLAATARLTVALGLPFLVFVGGGGTWRRRGTSAAVGLAIPLAALGLYDIASTGQIFSPVYDHLYQVEIGFYPQFFPYLDYHADWSIEDPRYILQNLHLMLLNLPVIGAPCPEGLASTPFEAVCVLQPRADGMSLLLTSPALLLALPALRGWGRARVATGATIAVLLIAVADLMHFSQGWVQFGYRFSNDLMPFALLLVALGLERLGGVRRVAVVLIVASIAVNLWGVAWGHLLGW